MGQSDCYASTYSRISPLRLFWPGPTRLPPEGIKSDAGTPPVTAPTQSTDRNLIYLILALVVMVAGFQIADRFVFEPGASGETSIASSGLTLSRRFRINLGCHSAPARSGDQCRHCTVPRRHPVGLLGGERGGKSRVIPAEPRPARGTYFPCRQWSHAVFLTRRPVDWIQNQRHQQDFSERRHRSVTDGKRA